MYFPEMSDVEAVRSLRKMDWGMSETDVSPWRVVDALQEEPQPEREAG